MIVSIHQPDYIPYIGYFYKIAAADKFVFLDDCQFSNDNFHHWNRIKTPQGECRLKIPVEYNFGNPIIKVRTKDEINWKEKHLKTIEMNYKKSRYFKDVFSGLRELILSDYNNLADQNIEINKWICSRFGMDTKFYRSSEMNIETSKEERVIDICKEIGATTYISGKGAKAYQVEEHFTERCVNLRYTNYHTFQYDQLWGDFLPNMSVIDFVFNCGFDLDYIIRNLRNQ